MTKRLLAFVAALAVLSAPVALEVCRITCDSKVMPPSMSDADGQPTHHDVPAKDASCHEPPSTGPQLSPSGIPCDHGVQGTPSLVAAKGSDTAVSSPAVVPVSHSSESLETGDTGSLGGSAWADRLAVPLAIPLRV
jgi:hypothetical protein